MKCFSLIAVVALLSCSTLWGGDVEKPTAKKSPVVGERVTELNAGIKSFRLAIDYFGPQDKPFYHVILSVTPANVRRNDAFHLYVTISQDLAKRLIDHLADDGFLEHSKDITHGENHSRELTGPVYTLTASVDSDAHRMTLQSGLGWDLAMLERLDKLQKALGKDPAADAMETLINRMTGYRKMWEKKAP